MSFADALSRRHRRSVWRGTIASNLIYGAAVCRLCYYRQLEALPEAGDIEGQAGFWKQHYNTPFSAGSVSKYAFKVQKTLGEGVVH